MSATNNQSLAPGVAHLTLTGRQPSILLASTLAPGKAALVLTGRQPSIVQVPATGVYPDPGDVSEGVLYGPSGSDYVGTKKSGSAFLRRR